MQCHLLASIWMELKCIIPNVCIHNTSTLYCIWSKKAVDLKNDQELGVTSIECKRKNIIQIVFIRKRPSLLKRYEQKWMRCCFWWQKHLVCFCSTKYLCSMCIYNHTQSTFFWLGNFLKKLGDGQCSSIITGSIYLNTKHMYIQPFSMEVDWPEIWCIMEVSTTFSCCMYCIFTLWGRFHNVF